MMPWLPVLVLAAALTVGICLDWLRRTYRNPNGEAANQRLLDELRRQP